MKTNFEEMEIEISLECHQLTRTNTVIYYHTAWSERIDKCALPHPGAPKEEYEWQWGRWTRRFAGQTCRHVVIILVSKEIALPVESMETSTRRYYMCQTREFWRL